MEVEILRNDLNWLNFSLYLGISDTMGRVSDDASDFGMTNLLLSTFPNHGHYGDAETILSQILSNVASSRNVIQCMQS